MRLGTPFRRSDSRLCRGVVAIVSVLGYLVAVVGYPLPAVVRKSGQPFPCQHHACGCMDAEQCWRGCCCFTPQQKLAWARENHVTPPADAEQAAHESQLAGHEHHDEHEQHADHDHAPGCERPAAALHVARRAPHSCCTSHATGAGDQPLAAESPARSGRTCGEESLADKDASTATSTSDEGPVRFVSGDAWRRCHGLPAMWVTTGAALQPPAAIQWQFSWDVVEWLSTAPSNLYGGCLAPPVPPPRV